MSLVSPPPTPNRPGTSGSSRRSSPLAGILLGRDPDMQRRLSIVLIGLLLYLLNTGVTWWSIQEGYLDALRGYILMVALVVGPFTFYGLVRSGYSMRFRDPAMVMQQCLFCVMTVVWAYSAVVIQFRGSVLSILPLVLMAGQFTLRPSQINQINLVAIGALLAVTAFGWLTHAKNSLMSADLVQMVYISGILAATSSVAQIVSRMRNNLERSRADLADALARMRDMATHDELTGLANRRRMVEQLAEEMKRERRVDHPLSLALLDLDHFKRVNDSFGHQTGDDVLRRFSEVAKASLREVDMLARWGGEEFLLLCPGSTADKLAVGLERLRQQLATQTLLQQQPQVTVTFSAGTVQYRPGEAIEEAIARADRALYEAKAGGRNRTIQG